MSIHLEGKEFHVHEDVVSVGVAHVGRRQHEAPHHISGNTQHDHCRTEKPSLACLWCLWDGTRNQNRCDLMLLAAVEYETEALLGAQAVGARCTKRLKKRGKGGRDKR